MKKIRVIVVDDERSSREEVKKSLKGYPDFEVVAEATNVDDAKEQIETEQPDLIFLDIQMPEKSGFDLLESLEKAPYVIFTTAYDQYAVNAFEANALDYLMKPIREERFAKAIEKARLAIGQKLAGAADRQLFIKDGEKCFFVRVNDISLIESLDNYSRLYFNGEKAILKRSLRQWEEILNPALFFRISRTEVINTNYVQQIVSMPKGRIKIKLKTGQLLAVSSRQSAKFKNLNSI